MKREQIELREFLREGFKNRKKKNSKTVNSTRCQKNQGGLAAWKSSREKVTDGRSHPIKGAKYSLDWTRRQLPDLATD